MSASKRSPLFVAALFVLGLVAAGESYCIYERSTAARAADKNLAQKRAALATLALATPAPSRETAVQIEADLARAQRALAIMQAELRGRGPAAERLKSAKAPAARTDAFSTLRPSSRPRAPARNSRVSPSRPPPRISVFRSTPTKPRSPRSLRRFSTSASSCNISRRRCSTLARARSCASSANAR